MKYIKSIRNLIICLLLLSVSEPIFANDAKEVEGYLKTNLDKVFAVLKNNALDQKSKTKEIVGIVSPMFDFPLITKLSFGKTYWTGMTKEQQKQFVELFIKLLKKSFIEKLVLYTDEKIVIKEPVQKKIKLKYQLFWYQKKIILICPINFINPKQKIGKSMI